MERDSLQGCDSRTRGTGFKPKEGTFELDTRKSSVWAPSGSIRQERWSRPPSQSHSLCSEGSPPFCLEGQVGWAVQMEKNSAPLLSHESLLGQWKLHPSKRCSTCVLSCTNCPTMPWLRHHTLCLLWSHAVRAAKTLLVPMVKQWSYMFTLKRGVIS